MVVGLAMAASAMAPFPASDSNALAVVLAIIALVPAADAGGFGLMRRRPGAG
jgi:hypothetical protein